MNAKTTVRIAALTSLLAFAAMAPDNSVPISGTNTPVAGSSLITAFLYKVGQYAEMESGATALAFTPNSSRHDLFASAR